jgi:aspartyl-tRNA(Asn)/glutamyl-tRNA(Gln) amidotransferase subunit A
MGYLTLDRYRFTGIAELKGWLEQGETTPFELAQLAELALQEYAAPLNAVTTLTPQRAALEASVANGPLAGLPYGAKDLLATGGGIPTTWGAYPLRHQQFQEDATVLKLLREAGAVLVAKLAMVELAGGMGYGQPNAALTGPGRNPWNPNRWSGGSSSGSAVAVGCGALPFSLGSETWGSILTPASYCGVVGVRPTYGLVSRSGAMALTWSMDKIGAYARNVPDVARVLEIIGKPDKADPASSGREFTFRPHMFENRRWRFGLVRSEIESADPEVAGTLEGMAVLLEKLGEVRFVDMEDLPYAQVARLIIEAEAAAAFEEFIEAGHTAELTAPEDRVNPFSYLTISATDYIRALRVRRRIVHHLDALFEQVDFLLAPSTAMTAVPVDQDFKHSFGPKRMARISAASNLAGLPAVSLPIGLDSNRLPVGMQLVAPAFQDEALLVCAAQIEKISEPLGRPF